MKNRISAFRLVTAGIPFGILLAVIALFMFSNPVYNPKISKTRKVTNGEVSLADNRYGITQIQGEWLFWWQRFVADTKDVSGTKLAVLPGAWTSSGISDRFGYASYGLRVSGLDPAKRYAFRLGQTLSSCRILVNGEVIRSIGTPGTSKAAEHPYWNTINAQFAPSADGTADLVLQVSNFHDRNGGSNASMYIGEASLMFRMEDCQKMTEGLVFSVLAIMGLFFLALFAFRRKDWYFFWFACICLIVGFRTLCYDGCVLLDLFPAGLHLRDRRHHLRRHRQADQGLVHRLPVYAAPHARAARADGVSQARGDRPPRRTTSTRRRAVVSLPFGNRLASE